MAMGSSTWGRKPVMMATTKQRMPVPTSVWMLAAAMGFSGKGKRPVTMATRKPVTPASTIARKPAAVMVSCMWDRKRAMTAMRTQLMSATTAVEPVVVMVSSKAKRNATMVTPSRKTRASMIVFQLAVVMAFCGKEKRPVMTAMWTMVMIVSTTAARPAAAMVWFTWGRKPAMMAMKRRMMTV